MDDGNRDDGPRRPAWREPMLWLVAGVPLAALVGGLWLVFVASRGGSVDAVTDDVRRTGQMQVADLGPDARAAELRLGAVFQVFGDRLRVFPVSGDLPRGEPLALTLLHPQRQAADRTVELVPDDDGWHADGPLDGGHAWIVHLSDTRGTWRLRGRLPAGQQAAHLAPSLDAPSQGARSPDPR